MEITEIKNRLNQDAEGIARLLLPNGKKTGKDWCVGSIHGEEGQSLKVCISGRRTGVWADFQTGDKGDLITLWQMSKGMTLPDALNDIRKHFGWAEPEFAPRRQKQYKKPQQVQNTKCHEAVNYLTQVRLLTAETLKAFRVESVADELFRRENVKSHAYYLPYYKEGVLVHWKKIGLDPSPKGKKLITTSSGSEPCLFGWHTVNFDSREIVITEGEIDAMTMHQYGFNAVSIPFGAGTGDKLNWIDNDYQMLDQFEKIYLCLDNDEAGKNTIPEMAQRLGMHRCFTVDMFGFKDANEALKGGITKENMAAFIGDASPVKPDELKFASDYEEALIDRFHNPDRGQIGYKLPFNYLDNKLRLRMSELSIWTGINGHGKSEVLNNVLVGLMAQGIPVCVASMEIKPIETLMRLTRQSTACREPSAEYISETVRWFGNNLMIFSVTGTAKKERIFEVFEYARKRYGARFFVIDSLMKCGIGEDDFTGQKAFVESICDFNENFDCHTALVAHSRKGQTEKDVPGKLDIKGTGAITDLADTVVTIWRDKEKENRLSRDDTDEHWDHKPDGKLVCSKQRNGEWEGFIKLWFHQDSKQFRDNRTAPPFRYVPFSTM